MSDFRVWTYGDWEKRLPAGLPDHLAYSGRFVIVSVNPNTKTETLICEMPHASTRGDQGRESNANGNLMASAPALYEALADIVSCYFVGSKPERFLENVRDFMVAGQAALARARGETP